MSTPIHPLPARALGHEQLTVSTAAVALQQAPENARRTVIRTLGQDINWRDDGADPTASDGMALLADETLVFDGDPFLIRLIRASTASGDADVRVAYYE